MKGKPHCRVLPTRYSTVIELKSGLILPALLAAPCIGAHAQTYPAKPIRIIVGQSAEVRARLSNEGAEPGNLTLDQFAAFLHTDAARWMKVIKLSGATAD